MTFTAQRFLLKGMLWSACIYHFFCGGCILLNPACRRVTGMGFVHDLFGTSDCLIYFFIALTAFWSLCGVGINGRIAHAALMVPQQLILVLTGVGEISVVMRGVYPDGYAPAGGWVFILIDQLPPILLTAGHTLTVWYLWTQTQPKK